MVCICSLLYCCGLANATLAVKRYHLYLRLFFATNNVAMHVVYELQLLALLSDNNNNVSNSQFKVSWSLLNSPTSTPHINNVLFTKTFFIPVKFT